MLNPFITESRDARLALNLEGFCTKLRAPESLHRLVMHTKPDHVGLGDHLLSALLNDVIDTYKIRRDYRGLHSLLGTLFGEPGAGTASVVTEGTNGNDRHHRGR